MADCRVGFDPDAQQHTLEFAVVDPSCRVIELPSMTAWVGASGLAMLTVDRGLDGNLSPSTEQWLRDNLSNDLAEAVRMSLDVVVSVADGLAIGVAGAIDALHWSESTTETLPVPITGDGAVRETDAALIVPRGSEGGRLTGESWIPVGRENGDLPIDPDRPASVMWNPPTGEFVVRLPTRGDREWPAELWLRITEDADGWIIAAAPISPSGEARTLVARREASFDGLRLDLGRNVSEATALDSRRSRERLASLAAVATEAEQAGDYATAAAAWTAAAAFADELLDDSAAERFRHRASESADSSERHRPAGGLRRWWLAVALVLVAALLVGLGVWLGSGDAGSGSPSPAGAESLAVATTAVTETTAATDLETTTSTKSTTSTSSTTTIPVPSGPVRSSGLFTQLVGEGHGPLQSTLEVEITTPTVPVGGAVEVAFKFTYDDVGGYPPNKYDECLAAVGKSRNTGGWKNDVPPYVVVARAGDVDPAALSSYLVDLPLSAPREIGVGPVSLLDSQVLDCGDPPPADTEFLVDQHLIFRTYTASIDVSDLGPGTYVLIPLMTLTATNTDGHPDSVDGPLVGFTIE